MNLDLKKHPYSVEKQHSPVKAMYGSVPPLTRANDHGHVPLRDFNMIALK